jgi:inactivated superfamily I helicase
MPATRFESACDTLSNAVDPVQFERLRWGRSEGPMLARLVELAQAAMSGREDFDLVEEGSTRDAKRYTVKVYSGRVAALVLSLDDGRGVASIVDTERSKCRVVDAVPVSAEFSTIDAEWMANALGQLLSHVQPLEAAAA